MQKNGKKKTLKLVGAKARQKQQQKYIETVVEPAKRLAELIGELEKRKGSTSRLRSA